MAKLKVVNLANQETGSVELHDNIANAALHPYLVKDAVTAYMAKLRQGTHMVKDRSLVSGARRKLFRQKGTGNARQGYPQAPHRRHGGTVFGPVVRSHEIGINKKEKKKALASVLAEKLRNQQLVVVEDLKVSSPKTKELGAKLNAMNLNRALIVFEELDENFILASRNLPYLQVKHAGSLNVYDILRHETLVITKAALQAVEGRLLK